MIKIKKIDLSNAEIFLCMLWGGKLLSYITAICLRLPVINSIARSVVPVILAITFLYAFKEFSKSISRGNIAFYLISTFVFLTTFLFYPDNVYYLNMVIVDFLFASLPFVFVGRAININRLVQPFYIISLLVILAEAVNVLFLEIDERAMSGYEYDMYTAFRMLPHFLMVLWHLMKKINLIDIAATLVGFFLLMGYGCRGAIVCAFFFVGIYLLFGREGKKKWWSYFLIIMVITGIIYAFNNLFSEINIGIEMFGLSSRIFNAYESDMLSDDSGRGAIQAIVIQSLKDSGPFGLGICGDRTVSGSYSHNIIIEFLASFGWFLGIILLLALVILVYKAWHFCQTPEEKGFLLLLIGENAQLITSGSFLTSSFFFMLIGYSARIIFNGRKKREISLPHNNIKTAFSKYY